MVIMTRTRSGRHIKKPVLFQPTEHILEDDYATDEHDTDLDSDIDTDDEVYDEDDSEEDDDADENGNLKDFVVEDESESEEEVA
jgi:hypothetical protein|tara:strand:+ start:1401 stop:1652 length:252 start_codon:yes stop_codon:yes gene_type:complete